jgi:NAD(P)-dependent dehydrogenase (short-subunit alcohol dehydrogenase family)
MASKKTAIVTGASQGIGAAIARPFMDRSEYHWRAPNGRTPTDVPREGRCPAMNGTNKAAIKPSATERSHSWTGLSCPEWEERSYLRTLVAELLYRNQVLRFALIEARDQVERIERVGSDSVSNNVF